MQKERRLILSSQFLSEIGDWITFGSIMLLVYQLTSSPLYISLVMISQNIAVILSSSIGGTLADRYNPKTLMILSDVARAGLVCLIPLAATSYWLIYPILMLIVVFSCLFTPAKMKVIRQVCTNEELGSMNSMSFGISGIVKILGFVGGGFLIAFSGYQMPFFIDAGTFILSALLLTGIRYSVEPAQQQAQAGDAAKPSFWSDMRAGWQEIRQISSLPKLLFIFVAGSLVMGLFVPQLVVFNSEMLHGNETTYGMLNAAVAVGMLIASAFFVRLVQKWDPYRTMIVTAFLCLGLVLVALTWLPYPFVLAALVLLGVFQATPNLVALTLCQMIVPERLLGRFFGMLNVFTTTAYVTGMLIGGLVASSSIVWMYRGTGLFALCIFVLGLVFQRRLRGGIAYAESGAVPPTSAKH